MAIRTSPVSCDPDAFVVLSDDWPCDGAWSWDWPPYGSVGSVRPPCPPSDHDQSPFPGIGVVPSEPPVATWLWLDPLDAVSLLPEPWWPIAYPATAAPAIPVTSAAAVTVASTRRPRRGCGGSAWNGGGGGAK